MAMYMRLKRNDDKVSFSDNKDGKEQLRTSNEIPYTRKRFAKSLNIGMKSRLGYVYGYKQRKVDRNIHLSQFITKTVLEALDDRRDKME